jgi:proteasome lid subunit RPN8/RPN11
MPPEPTLLIARPLWGRLTAELHRRTEGYHESGAFFLGRIEGDHRRVERVIYYDELDPSAYSSGVVILHAPSFGPLWDRCREWGLSVVADVHVHEFGAGQSAPDRQNPMIAQAGHIALILPNFARLPILPEKIGFYEYSGSHRWRDFSGRDVARCLRLE